MATKQFYATGAFRYGTRMLRAGDPVELDAAHARIFTALGKISPDKPTAAAAKPAATEQESPVPTMTTENTGKPAAKKPATKRTTRRKK